ncbi:hypothetical protein SMICM304S_03499 [Streptomyces microflavus]
MRPPQHPARGNPEVVGEAAAGALEHRQGFGLASVPVQRPHQHPPGQRLVEGVRRHQGEQFVDRLRVLPEAQLPFDLPPYDGDPALGEPQPLQLGERPRQTGQGLPVEQLQRLGAEADRFERLARPPGLPDAGDQLPHVCHVHVDRAGDQLVATEPALDDRVRTTLVVQGLAQPVDVHRHHVRDRRLHPPYVVQQLLLTEGPSRAERQGRQDGLLAQMPQVEEAPVPPRPHRPEQGDPHLRRRFRRSHGDSEGGRSRRPGAGATARDDQTAVEGVDDRGGPVTQTELHQDPREVLGHGVLGDGELGGDLVVPQAAADRGEHLALLMTELGRGGAEERGGAWSVGGEGRRHRCSPGSGGVGLAGAVDKVLGRAGQGIRNDPE